ncbi:hypothetical protein F3Y22_tig00111655pilonHSYRG00004 [Hibiscus syriacus]|uniref:Reverse transcriptase Ty1/copia-type domain-containing protein n=1 Tax=Hibiscus syriacus TaxID=106335 RepID=A0A6A2YFR6_HIBSY|nr:hypothetical protein F3Y22_tig00111655pilonHSYRG00004 [Hibiscus syriacus]
MQNYVRSSPNRILALKSKLARNPRGSLSILAYFKDMQYIAAGLALVGSSISDTYLLIFVINHLGNYYRPIVATLHVRNTTTTMVEISKILMDHEQTLQYDDHSSFPSLATANVTQNAFTSSSHTSCYRDPEPPVLNPTVAHTTSTSSPWMNDSGASHHTTMSPVVLNDFSTYDGPDEIHLGNDHLLVQTLEPKTIITQALKDSLWRAAMDDEYLALLRNHTWDLDPRSAQPIIGCKWMFYVKHHPDGSIDRYKACLVAKGYS